jgi:hypothetical protein
VQQSITLGVLEPAFSPIQYWLAPTEGQVRDRSDGLNDAAQ